MYEDGIAYVSIHYADCSFTMEPCKPVGSVAQRHVKEKSDQIVENYAP